MKRARTLIMIGLMLPTLLFSQCLDCEYIDGMIWVVISRELKEQSTGIPDIRELELSSALVEFNTSSLIPVFPSSKKELLQRVYKIKFDGKTEDFVNILSEINEGQFEKIIKRPVDNKIALYDPSDYMWQAHIDWLWHLTIIEADLAWDVTKGSEDIKVAILDTWFDINHPDLADKISPTYDPYDNTYFSTDCSKNNHGTAVASYVAAETDGGGQLASVGFNCMIVPYQAWDGDYLERAHHASLNMGADVLTSSAGGWSCRLPTDTDPIEEAAVQEIIENGTIIVMPAGNGEYGTQCKPTGATQASPFFPLHPAYDSDIIIVTSIGSDNKHYYYDPDDDREETHSHYPEVDICSPGYLVMGARCTEYDNCDPGVCCVPDSWPYYGSQIGTSFATPIVAGVVALMKSIDPCLTQAEAQTIITSTADPVSDASNYTGLIGAGRINAYEAVKMAGTVNLTNMTISNTRSFSAGYALNLENTTISQYGNLTLVARKEININSPFEIQSGGILYINHEDDAINTCD